MTNLNISPYYDDFNESKNFHQILFKPGLAVQARELTQIQSIISNQIKRFGDHIFKDGSVVMGGGVNYNDMHRAFRTADIIDFNNIADYRETPYYLFISTGTNKGWIGAITFFETSDNVSVDNPHIFYITNEFNNPTTGEPFILSLDDTFVILTEDEYKAITEDVNNYVVGLGSFNLSTLPTKASLASVDVGVTYFNGYFVYNEKEYIAIDRENSAVTSIIGFNYIESFVTPYDDYSLLDPAQGSTNYAAPGADRLKAYVELAKIDWDGVNEPTLTEQFIELMRVKTGVIQTLRRQPVYSDIMDTMARRTYDESGNYTIRPFTAYVKEVDPDNDYALIEISAGKAYVKGYENEKAAPTTIKLDRALEQDTYEGIDISAYYGNYTKVTFVSSGAGSVFPSMGDKVSLIDGSNADIGYAFIRSFQYSGNAGVYNLFLFDLNISTGSFGNTRSIIKGTPGDPTWKVAIDAGSIVLGQAQLYDTQYDIGIFNLSQSWVSEIPRIEYRSRKSFLNREIYDDTVSITLGGTEKFFPIGAVPPATKNVNFLVFDRNTGNIINLSGTDITVSPDGYTATFDFNTTAYDGHLVDIIASTDVENPLTRTKTPQNFSGTFSATSGTRYSLGKTDVTGIGVFVNDLNFETKTGTYVADGDKVVITLSAPHELVAGSKVWISLSANPFFSGFRTVDVLSPTAISFDDDITGNGTVSVYVGTDITSHFEFDNGQRDHYYDCSTIIHNTGVSQPIFVCGSYYQHSVGQIHFTVDSYSPDSNAGTPRQDIYSYSSRRTNKVYVLRDCIDFRFDRSAYPSLGAAYTVPGTGLTTGIFTTVQLPVQFETINTDYSFYMPRIDKIVMMSTGDFRVLKGVPSIQRPQVPIDIEDAMTLFIANVSAFTPYKNSISLVSTNNRRYTMKDIAKIDSRVSQLEYYTALSLLEKETANQNVYDSEGNSIFKNGFFVEAFASPQIANINSEEFSCAIDPIDKTCKPVIETKLINFKIDPGFSGFSAASTGVVASVPLLGVGEGVGPHTPIIIQPLISDYINVNPFNVIRRAGILTIEPSSDIWTDTETVPTYVTVEGSNTTVTNTTTNYNNNHWGWWGGYWGYYGYWTGAYWGGYNYYWHPVTGWGWYPYETEKVTSSSSTTTITEVSREVSSTRITPIPWVRSRDVKFNVAGMQPYTKLYILFDNVDISDRVAGGSIITDKFGSMTGTFTIPDPKTDTRKFATGTNNVTLSSIDNLSAIDSNTSIASTTYTTSGSLMTQNVTVTQRRDTTTTVNVEKTVTTPWWNYWGWWGCWGWWDPVAQSFLIDPQLYPEGVSISKISLFFKRKDAVTPVTVQLRPSVNGYPDSKNVFPFGSKTLTPDQVNVSSDGTAITDFVFDIPIHLPAGEYTFVVMSNCNNYEIFYAGIGRPEMRTNVRITEQPYTGSMFTSQNGSTWTADQYSDLAFVIHKGNFKQIGNPADENRFTVPLIQAEAFPDPLDFTYQLAYIPTVDVQTSGDLGGNPITTVEYYLTTKNQANEPIENQIIAGDEITFTASQVMSVASSDDASLKIKLKTSSAEISPMIDLQNVGIMLGKVKINSKAEADLLGDETDSRGGGAQCKYVSRSVTLAEGLDADKLNVYVGVSKPSGTSIEVYYKVLNAADNASFTERPYVKMPMVPKAYDVTKVGEYVEDEYTAENISYVAGSATYTGFKTFAIKVVMYSNNPCFYPILKNIRAIAGS